jgi:hypothetical protein
MATVITDFPDYTIDETGKVYSTIHNRYLQPCVNKGGYYQVSLYTGYKSFKTKKLHRLVAEAFIHNPHNLSTVNHINGDKSDNSVGNLEWLSPADNNKHAFSTGLKSISRTSNPKAKLTESEVSTIQSLIGKQSLVSIATLYNVHVDTIGRIKRRETWK